MKISLGKLLILLIIPFILNGQVTLNAPKEFYKGEAVVFKITAKGSDIKFPQIKSIEGYSVQSAGTSTQTSIINGLRTQSVSKTFAFRPKKTVTIPAFSITVDGKSEKTKAITIKAKELKKTVSKYYALDIDVDKKSVYVGEAVKFTLKFKYRKDLQIVDLEFVNPEFENFWAKELTSDNKKTAGNFVEQELNYLLFPQKSGKITIEPLKIGVVVVDSRYNNRYSGFFNTTSTKTIPVYSNKIELDVKPLPGGVKLIGDFKIDAKIDKKRIKSGESVSLKIVIDGRGNLDDIDEIKLDIKDATIYDNPSKKEYNLKNGIYGGTYTKTYSIVSSKDFTVPSVNLSYFDKKSGSVKNVSTKAYDIEVIDEVQKDKPKLQVSDIEYSETSKSKEKVIEKIVTTSDNEKIIYFFIGLFSGIVLSFVVYLLRNRDRKKEELPIEKLIKKSNSSKELLKLMVVYINIDKELDKIIYSLEKDIPKDELKKIKKDIMVLIKDKKLDI